MVTLAAWAWRRAASGRDNEDDDVRDVRAARTHGGECRVTRGVDEGDGVALPVDRVGADPLGDATGLPRGHFGATDGVEQRGLPVVDMAHEGDDRTAGFLGLGLLLDRLGRLDHELLLLVNPAAGNAFFPLEHKSVEVAELAGDLGLHALVDVGEDLHAHQIPDDLEGRHTHLGGKFLDLDRGLDVDDLARLSAFRILDKNHLFRRRLHRLHGSGGRFHRFGALPDAWKGLARGSNTLFGGGLVDQGECRQISGLDDRLLDLFLLGRGRGPRLGCSTLGRGGFGRSAGTGDRSGA